MSRATWHGAFSLISKADISRKINISVDKWLQKSLNGLIGKTTENTVLKIIEHEKEIETLRMVAHENITPILASFVLSFGGHTAHGMVMPLYKSDLYWFIIGHIETKKQIDIETARKVCCDIAKGLQHIHSKGWVHGDIKPENIFIDENGKAIIGDFGGSSREGDPITSATFGYASPELIVSKNGCSPCDVWSLACVVYVMLNLKLLFSGRDAEILYTHMWALDIPTERSLKKYYADQIVFDEHLCGRKYEGVEITLSQPPFCLPIGDTPLHKVLYQCLKWDPSSRPSAERIVELLL